MNLAIPTQRQLDRLALTNGDRRLPGHAVYCEVKGCGARTREGKPWCSDHLDSNPYVAAIMDRLAAHASELATIEEARKRQARARGPFPILEEEILFVLAPHGRRTLERIARDAHLSAHVVDVVAVRLMRRGLISFASNSRGKTVLVMRAETTTPAVDPAGVSGVRCEAASV